MKTRKTVIYILLIIIMLFVSCTNNPEINEEQASNQQTQTDEVAQPTDVASDASMQAKGEIVTSDRIENQEGNYFIPIPDSWFRKVSYELDGTSTYIYHITHDPNELEINPVLLHIDVLKNMDPDTLGVNIFMKIGEMCFYEVLRMDAPYNPESEDGVEFLALYEDVPQILQSVWLLDESEWQEQINSIEPTHTAFTESDARIGTLFINQSTKDETLAAIDEEPISTEETTWEATGDYVEEYEFSFGKITFINDVLAIANIENSSIYGPRDFTVGDYMDNVVEEFTGDVELDNDNITILYRLNSGDEDTTILPPSAVIHKYLGDTAFTMVLSCFDSDEDIADMSIEDLKEEIAYIPHYECVFYFDEDCIMTNYTINYMASAE